MKRFVFRLLCLLVMVIGTVSFTNKKNNITLTDTHDLILAIPNITPADVQVIVNDISTMNGVKAVRFCYNMECLIVIKSAKTPANSTTIVNRVNFLFPDYRTFVKDYSTVAEFEQQCNFIKK